jgi:hypothetical protein
MDCINNNQWQTKLKRAWELTFTHALPKAGSLRKNFAPERAEPNDDAMKIILDIIGLGFLVVSHGTWHNVSFLSLLSWSS